MLISNLGNDDPMQGELQAGWIARYDTLTGEFIENFIDSGGEGNISQPNALLLLPSAIDFDCNGDGAVNAGDLDCGCSVGIDAMLAELDLIPGDFDGNGEVAFLDFLVLADNFGEVGGYRDGDLNCDGTVEFLDFLSFAANFGKTSAVASSVPEPNAMLTLTLGLGLLVGTRRRR